MIGTRIFTILLFSFFSLGLLSCEDEGDASKVTITQLADTPKVINSNFTVDPTPNDSDSGDEIDVVGPWFPLRFIGTNGSGRTLTIATFVIEVTGKTASGATSKKEWTLDLGNKSVLLEAEAGESFELEQFVYVDGLPDSVNRNYKAKMTFEGWFNKVDDEDTDVDESTQPDESFTKVVRFRTQ